MSDETQLMGKFKTGSALLRPYRTDDRAQVREVCCRTAFRNLGVQAIFDQKEDQEMFADYWSRYYTDYEPESVWVAEQEGRVVGYLFGCVDSRRFVWTMAWRIVPVILARLCWRMALGRYRRGRGRLFVRWLLMRSWREAPEVPLHTYPAHFHCNILPGGYNQGLYTSLALGFLDYLTSRGVTHMHGQLLEPKFKGIYHRLLKSYSRSHPDWIQFSSEKATNFGKDVLETPTELVNRAYGFMISDYRDFLHWMAREYRL